MAAVPPLPLSQQVLAWVLRALGLADDEAVDIGVSTGTLKNAQRGAPIPRTWDGLVDGVLFVLGATPDERARGELRSLLRSWDEKVGALPPVAELSVAERLHAPLTFAMPAVGLRLGALAAMLASRTRTPIAEWIWLAEPFDKLFFGRVVRALFRYRFPDATIDDLRALLEQDEDNKIVDWRTVERWYSGDISVPNAKALAPLGALLGPGAEMMLRAARLAAVFREHACEWIGADATADWARGVAAVGRETANALAAPATAASLLRWLCDDLDGPMGDRVRELMQPFLLHGADALSRAELSRAFATAASDLEIGRAEAQPIASWVIGMMVLLPDLRLSVHICEILDIPLLGAFGAMDRVRLIEHDWQCRLLMKTVAAGGALTVTRPDGSVVEHAISDSARDAARRWASRSIGFSRSADAPSLDIDAAQVIFELFGGEPIKAFMQSAQAPTELLLALLDPAAEHVLADDVVRESRALCLARACRLAEDGDSVGALQWFDRARHLGGATTGTETDHVLGMLAALAHGTLDKLRRMRELLRAIPKGDAPTGALDVLLAGARLAEALVERSMDIGDAPERSHALLSTLVTVVPVAIRVALLRKDLAAENDGLGGPAVTSLVDRLAGCLDGQPTHGRAWALLSLWKALSGDGDAASAAEENATHYGAAEFYEGEVERIEADLRLPEDAG